MKIDREANACLSDRPSPTGQQPPDRRRELLRAHPGYTHP